MRSKMCFHAKHFLAHHVFLCQRSDSVIGVCTDAPMPIRRQECSVAVLTAGRYHGRNCKHTLCLAHTYDKVGHSSVRLLCSRTAVGAELLKHRAASSLQTNLVRHPFALEQNRHSGEVSLTPLSLQSPSCKQIPRQKHQSCQPLERHSSTTSGHTANAKGMPLFQTLIQYPRTRMVTKSPQCSTASTGPSVVLGSIVVRQVPRTRGGAS